MKNKKLKFTKEILYCSIKKLPLIEKKILYLCVYENKKIDEISKLLGISKRQVSYLRYKGIKDFKKEVQKYKSIFESRGSLNGK